MPLHEKLDREFLLRAYRFSEAAHRGQLRNSGDPYITHSVEVAKILADLQLDSTTVASGLLHD
ncbi:MAG: HD domain-containing protein, partial [Gemmatimonadaceae bacterium]